MNKTSALLLVAVAAGSIGFAAGRGTAPEPAPMELDFVDPFAAQVAPPAAPATNDAAVAEAIDRATDEQRRANQAAEREARRDRYGY